MPTTCSITGFIEIRAQRNVYVNYFGGWMKTIIAYEDSRLQCCARQADATLWCSVMLYFEVDYDHGYARVVYACQRPMDSLRLQLLTTLSSLAPFQTRENDFTVVK